MSVKQLMSKQLITLNLDDDLAKAKETFDQHPIHHILIVEEGKLVGLLNDRDLQAQLSPNFGTRKESPQDIIQSKTKIHKIMARELITSNSNISLNEAVLLFHDHKISCLPIVNSQHKPLGVITWRDIMRVIAVQYRRKLAKERESANPIEV